MLVQMLDMKYMEATTGARRRTMMPAPAMRRSHQSCRHTQLMDKPSYLIDIIIIIITIVNYYNYTFEDCGSSMPSEPGFR